MIRLRDPEVSNSKTSNLVKGIMEILSYSRTQNKDFIQLKGLVMIFSSLARKNKILSTVQESYNFYSSENLGELYKLYFVSQKSRSKANTYLKEQIFYSHSRLQNIALLTDHFLTRYLNYSAGKDAAFPF